MVQAHNCVYVESNNSSANRYILRKALMCFCQIDVCSVFSVNKSIESSYLMKLNIEI